MERMVIKNWSNWVKGTLIGALVGLGMYISVAGRLDVAHRSPTFSKS